MAKDYKIYYKENGKTNPVKTYVTMVGMDANHRLHKQKAYSNRAEVLADARSYSENRFRDTVVIVKLGHEILFEYLNGERIR